MTKKQNSFDALSKEAQETAKGMIQHCIEHGLVMGMDEGFKDFETGERHGFVEELTAFTQEVSETS